MTTSTKANTSPTEDPTVKGTVTLRIAGITKYMDKAGQVTRSDVVQCGGLGWYITAKPVDHEGKRYLACFLEGLSGGPWSAWVSRTMRIVNKDYAESDHMDKDYAESDHIVNASESLYGSGSLSPGWGHHQFISKEALLSPENGFVTDDAVVIRVDFTIKNVYSCAFDIFGDEDALPSDVKFIVEDTAFYANKGYLSVISPMFRTMFSSNFAESGMQEIPLEDIKAHDFRQFLMAVYPMQQQLTGMYSTQVFQLFSWF
ncbi:BTB and MATH domain-containing protein 38 [Aphelenchoides avenae]|nr:BTB and MATH domain-containing protein 38 [Aphelenchus avenae]